MREETKHPAVVYSEQGWSCAVSILASYADRYGLDEKLARKIAGGFGGGMGFLGETCGAVTAAIMVIGLHFGTDDSTDSFKKQNTSALTAEVVERFKNERGSVLCRELSAGYDITSPEDVKALKESGLPALMIQTAGRILDDIIQEEKGDT